MSGIAGILHFDGRPADAALLARMTSAMAYRGPDGIHHAVDGEAALGQCLLHTTAEDLEQTLPLASDDLSLVLVMDGHLNNWQELRAALLDKGATLRTRADSELVLRAFEVWGEDRVLDHLDGDFAFVVWNRRTRSAFCARDRFGHKPLYYHFDGTRLLFTSELAPILDYPGIAARPNEGVIAEYVAQEWYTRDETLWLDVKRIVAAQCGRFERDRAVLRQYWRPDLGSPIVYNRTEDYLEHYRELITDCVRRTSRSHNPAACGVSGGLDSTAIFSLADNLLRSGQLPAPGLEGYTFSIPGDAFADELEFARAAGRHVGRTISEFPAMMPPLSWFEDQAHRYRDFPGFPGAAMPLDMFAAMREAGHRIVLTGDGGDEWLTGTRLSYAEFLRSGRVSDVFRMFTEDARRSGLRQGLAGLLKEGVVPCLSVDAQRRLRDGVRALRAGVKRKTSRRFANPSDLLSPHLSDRLAVQRERYSADVTREALSPVHRHQLALLHDPYFDRTFESAERIASEHQLERRSPMQTKQFVQFAFSTTEDLRYRNYTTKWLHRAALGEYLPPQIFSRSSKSDYSFVFRRQLSMMHTHLMRDVAPKRCAWVVRGELEKQFELFVNLRACNWPMWNLWGVVGCHFAIREMNPQ